MQARVILAPTNSQARQRNDNFAARPYQQATTQQTGGSATFQHGRVAGKLDLSGSYRVSTSHQPIKSAGSKTLQVALPCQSRGAAHHLSGRCVKCSGRNHPAIRQRGQDGTQCNASTHHNLDDSHGSASQLGRKQNPSARQLIRWAGSGTRQQATTPAMVSRPFRSRGSWT